MTNSLYVKWKQWRAVSQCTATYVCRWAENGHFLARRWNGSRRLARGFDMTDHVSLAFCIVCWFMPDWNWFSGIAFAWFVFRAMVGKCAIDWYWLCTVGPDYGLCTFGPIKPVKRYNSSALVPLRMHMLFPILPCTWPLTNTNPSLPRFSINHPEILDWMINLRQKAISKSHTRVATSVHSIILAFHDTFGYVDKNLCRIVGNKARKRDEAKPLTSLSVNFHSNQSTFSIRNKKCFRSKSAMFTYQRLFRGKTTTITEITFEKAHFVVREE